jgi:hypothetical protein
MTAASQVSREPQHVLENWRFMATIREVGYRNSAQGGCRKRTPSNIKQTEKAFVQDFSRAVRKMEIVFCQELPVKNPGLIITTHWKIQSMEWHHQALPRKNIFKIRTSADRVM